MCLQKTFRSLFTILLLYFVKRAQSAETVVKTAVEDLPLNQFVVANKPCQEGCLQYGNCNGELGECECPFGLSGPTCQTQLYPACRTTSKGGPQRIYLGRTAPRNCHCYRDLQRSLCLPGEDTRCAFHTMQIWDVLFCFERVDVPPDQQLSDLPDNWDDPAYRWGRGVTHRQQLDGRTSLHRSIQMLEHPPVSEEFISKSTSLSKCPARCNEQGVCQLWGGVQPSCRCFAGFGGSQCAELVQGESHPPCPNNCAGRGRCIGGFCKCDPPFWGVGCSRGQAYEPAKGSIAHPYYPSLKIYMYDIPPNVLGPHQFEDGEAGVFPNYQSFMRFMDTFLTDTSGIRTENPHEANLFYIPAFAYYSTSNLGDPTGALVRAVDWVSSRFPFFNRTRGRDHFVLLTGDRGACYLKPTPQTENLIKLTHFGYERYNISDMGSQVENVDHGCFKSGRDIVMAPYFKAKAAKIRELHARLEEAGGLEAMIAKKDVLFFFSGDIRHNEPEYSGGVRQALSLLLEKNSYPDVVFKGGYMPLNGNDYEDLLARSKFCLAPYGHGWGIRLTHALMHACVPVIIQDKVRQPYEDILHYPDFSVRVSKAELPRLVDILRAVTPEELLRATRENARVYRAFLWQPELGGLAYNYTIASLHRRLSHLRGELYEAGVRRH